MDLRKLILAILLIPLVIASAIAIMALSYLLVPVAIAGFVGLAIYIVMEGNSHKRE